MTDVIKQYLLQGYATTQMNLSITVISILLTAVLAIYIYEVYKRVNHNSFYNKNFNLALISISIITAAIILTIQSNIVVSLGMVGALSIIRFRTAIKDPMDLVFMFWAISVGIICGAGFAAIAIVASLVLTIVIIYISRVSVSHRNMILILNLEDFEAENSAIDLIKSKCRFYKLRAKNMTKSRINMAIEIETEEEKELMKALISLEGITDASIVENTGDVTV